MKATAVVLVGGKSTRMGVDKALLKIGGETMLQCIVTELKKDFPEVLIANSSNSKYRITGVREISDVFIGMGPLAGIHVGLKEAKYNNVFFTACDMPLIDSQMAIFIVKQIEGFDIAVPKIGRYLQPLFAAYSKKCLPYIEYSLQNGVKKIATIYDKMNVNYIEAELLSVSYELEKVFLNINTPEDYKITVERKNLY